MRHLSPPRDPFSGMYYLSSTWLLHLGCATCPSEPLAFRTQENNELPSPSLYKPRISIHRFLYEIQQSPVVWIQWSRFFQSFPRTRAAHHASPPMDGPNNFRDSSFLPQSASGFWVPGFRDLRKQGFFPFGFLSAEMTKCRLVATCPFDGRLRSLPTMNRYDLFKTINGHIQIPTFPNLFTLKTISAFRLSGFRDS